MWWRLRPTDFRHNSGADNRAAFKEIVDDGEPTGLIAYLDGAPSGWCSVAPREQMVRLRTSRTWKLVPGDEPVWSIACFFVTPSARGNAVAARLLRSAVHFATSKGASTVEAYPRDIGPARVGDDRIWYGTLDMFLSAGFHEIARSHPDFPIVRRAAH